MSRNASSSIHRSGLAGQGVAALWQLAGKSKPGMLQAAGILMVAAAFATGASWVMGTGIDAMVSRDLKGSLLYGIAFLAFEALAVALQYLGRRRLAIVTTEVALDTRLALIRKQAVLPMSWFDRQPVGRILTRLTNDVEGIEGFFGGTLARMMIAVIQMVTVFAGLLLMDPRFGAWTVIAALPALVFVFALNAPVRNWLRVFKRRSAHVNSLFAEFVSGISVLRTYSLGAWARGRLGSAVDDQFEAGMKVLHWNSLVRPAAVFLSALPMAFVIFSGGSEVAAGSMTIGTLAVFLRLAERYGTPVRTITQEIQVIQEALSSGERVHEMLVAGETMTNLDRDHDEYPVETAAGQLRAGVNGAVSFKNVSLRYQSGGNGTGARHGAGLKSALHDVTFDVRAGERIGIVGRTGSGKTSLVSLITGLYEPHAGEISIDGVPLARWDKEYLRRQLSFSTQDTVLFRGTLRENLLGFPGSDFEDWKSVEAACRESGLHDLMSADTSGRFDEGLESTVLAGGENFSAGEKQIIALTRALVTRPRILILDEATASVDRRIEDKAMKSITRLLPDCTCFIIAHKYRMLATCDRIFVMDEGKLLADMPPGSEVEIRERLRVMSASAPDLN
jgi:ABC-type multidrug transport system fused ATPase/permease subunit